jgi:mono/diheme cytochrome c family protein
MPTWSEKLGGPLRVDEIAAVAAFITNFETWALNPEMVPTPIIAGVDLSDPVSRGRFVFMQNICTACHTITGLSAGVGGPPLDGLAARAGERVPGLTAEEYVLTSILDPAAYIVEEFTDIEMPQIFSEILTTKQIEDLIAFLLTLEE